MPKIFNFKVIIEQDEDGIFVSSAPAIPGCHSQGKTYEEALKNIEEAIKLCLEVAKDNKQFRSKIDFSENAESRFIGVTQLPIKVSFS